MISGKLISLLKVFSKYELNRLRKFLQSPYFNDQEDVSRLFDLINSALRKGDAAVALLDKESIWKALYAKRKMDDAHLRRLISDLNQLALHFLVQEARAKDPLGEALELQKVLEKPELKKHLSGVERQIQRHLEVEQGRSAQSYFVNFQLHWTIYNRASKTVAASDYVDKLLPADYYLEVFYVVQKLKFYVSWLIFRGFRATPLELPMMPGFMEYLGNERFARVPLIIIYQNIILCLTKPEEERYFQNLISDLKNYADNLTKEDIRECYHIAQNYCAFKINQGKTEYYQEVFQIFKNIINLGILLEEEQLSEGVYKNIITTSLRVGEFEWAEAFIQEYSIHLPSDIRENARTFNLANLYSHQKKYGNVIELLRNVEYSDVVYALSAKLILIRTYFETDEFMALDSLIDSFRIYIRRNKLISNTLKTEYNNFLIFVKKLSTLPPNSPKMIERLRSQIERCNSVSSKKWLLEKIETYSR